MQELNDMVEVFFGNRELPLQPVLLQTENEVLSQAGLRLDQLSELDQLWTWVIFSLKDWLKNLNYSHRVTVNHFEVFEVLKTVRVLKVQVQLPFVLGIFLTYQKITPYKISSSIELFSIFLKLSSMYSEGFWKGFS